MGDNTVGTVVRVLVFGLVSGGLMLWGWGVDDVAGFLSHPARAVFFLVTVVVNSVTMLVVSAKGIELMNKGEREDSREALTGFVIPTVVNFLLLCVGPYSDSHDLLVLGGGDALRYAGLALFLVGYVLMIWGPFHLGKQYSWYVTIQKDHELVTDGPYRFMRHPRYSGIIWWILGMALVFHSIPALALAIVMCLCMLSRIPKEERMLRDVFPDGWEDYCRRTPHKSAPYVY